MKESIGTRITERFDNESWVVVSATALTVAFHGSIVTQAGIILHKYDLVREVQNLPSMSPGPEIAIMTGTLVGAAGLIIGFGALGVLILRRKGISLDS